MGEDGIIERIFAIISPINKYCVEFGAFDGKNLSNCCHLIESKGWFGAFIEGDVDRFSMLNDTHGNRENVLCIHKFIDFEGESSLDNILKAVNAPQDLDLLSIDVDGTDCFIWESLQEFQPRVVVIEFNPSIPNDVIFIQAKDAQVNQGCSLLALIFLAAEKGYELICCTQSNAFFVRSELYPIFEIPSNFIFHLYRPVADGRIFHGYDSQIHVVGMDKLLWSEIALSSDDFQVLPRSLRRFGDAQRNA